LIIEGAHNAAPHISVTELAIPARHSRAPTTKAGRIAGGNGQPDIARKQPDPL